MHAAADDVDGNHVVEFSLCNDGSVGISTYFKGELVAFVCIHSDDNTALRLGLDFSEMVALIKKQMRDRKRAA